jgi:peroxiredoxin
MYEPTKELISTASAICWRMKGFQIFSRQIYPFQPTTERLTMRAWILTFVLLLTVVLPASRSALDAAEAVKTLEIGDQAPRFELPGVDDRQYSLKDFADAKLLLVVFTCNHCPTAQAYESRMMQLHADYKDRGVALVAISPNDDQALRLDELGYTDLGDSFDDMKLRARQRGFSFPYLYDGETQKTAAAYGVVATPQVFLFDSERKLHYVGRIDDSDVRDVTSHDTRNAIDALLAGKPVPVEKTRTFGCSTKWSVKRADAEASIKKWNDEPVTVKSMNEDALATLVKNDTENLVLVNVWASWCAPCVMELPAFVTINRMYRHRKFELVTISMDEPDEGEAVLKNLRRNYVAATNYHLAIANRDRFADLLDKQWDGPVPYTLLIAPGGKVLYRKQGEIDPLEVKRAIVDVLGRTYASRDKK